MTTVNILRVLKSVGFESLEHFKKHMLGKAKLNEYGAICYTEKIDNLELNYSNNCVHKFGIGGYIKGQFVAHRFN